jgi:colanic acid/amylovoran biosynthesis glycosyltransferase
MHIAYLINQYPKVSHTFIRREILALEHLGFTITRIALRGWDGDLADNEDQIERGRTRYVLRDGFLPLFISLLRMLFARPVRLMRALTLAFRMGYRADRPFPLHLAYLAEACRIVWWLRVSNVQHVHAHFGTNSAEVAMLVHVLGGPSWSFTVHGPEEFDKPQFIGLAEKIRRAAFVIAVSSFGRSQLFRCVEHADWSKIVVVHCGLDLHFYADPHEYNASQALVCVGRLCEQKGQLLLVEATRRIIERGRNMQLTFVGDGELRPAIETLVSLHKLEKNVRVTGWLGSESVRSELIGARALVLPSFAEGLPVVIMEAMALRRPVISTFVAGIPELVSDGEHGWLVPAGDVEALVEAIQSCLDATSDTLIKMGYSARKKVMESHNVDKEAAKLAALFEAARSKSIVTVSPSRACKFSRKG